MIKIFLPELGEDITKATISYWHIEEGADVVEGEDLVEVTTDKATFNVPATCSGVLTEVVAHEGDVVEVGEVLAVMEEGADSPEGKDTEI